MTTQLLIKTRTDYERRVFLLSKNLVLVPVLVGPARFRKTKGNEALGRADKQAWTHKGGASHI